MMSVIVVSKKRSKSLLLLWQAILLIVVVLVVAVVQVQSYQQSPSRTTTSTGSHYVPSTQTGTSTRFGLKNHHQHEYTCRGGAATKPSSSKQLSKIRRVFTTTRLSSSDNNAIDKSSDSTDTTAAQSLGSITTSLIKSMLGTGVLALPGALAVASNYKSSLIPANILMATLGILSAYTFVLYGRLVDTTQAKTLGELWNNIYNDGNTSTGTDNSAIIVSIASFLFTFGVSVAYSLIIGDILTGFVSQFISSTTTIAMLSLRQLCILGITVTTLLPLCNLQSMSSLAPFSIIGTIGSLLTSAFIVWRCPTWNSASPYVNAAAVTTKGAFNTYNRMMNGSPAPLVLVATGLVSLSAHFGVCDFYHLIKKSSLTEKGKVTKKRSNNDNNKIIMSNFFKVTSSAFTVVAIVNAITMIAGFLTFGGNSLGIVLNNYKSTDIYATISKLLVGVSVIGAYPIVMNACKSELVSVLEQQRSNKKVSKTTTKSTPSTLTSTSTILLSIVTILALLIKDAGFVISLIGAVMGSSIIYTFPSLLFLRRNNKNDTKIERNFCRFLVGFGIFSAIIGGTTSVLNTFFPTMLG